MSDIISSGYFWVCVCSFLVSVACIFSLIRKNDSWIKKIIWIFILLIPVAGPIFYGGLYKTPSIQPNDMRAPDYDYTRYGGGGGGV